MKKEIDKDTALQGLLECLRSVPFLKIGNVNSSDEKLESDFQFEIWIKNRSFKILAEYKDTGEPRIARSASYQIREWVSKGLAEYGVFIAPYISSETASICADAGIGYFDLAGNCLISFDTIFIQREGKNNPLIQRRKLRSLYSSKAERILRVLLTLSKRNWKTEDLAKAAQVSYGQISKVKNLLIDREWLAERENGIRLKNPGAVLDEWATQYNYRRNQILDYYAMSNVSECELKLAEACQNQEINYAFTAFSGAARLAPTVRYQRMVAYIDSDPDFVANILGWKRVKSGANVSLLVPYDEGVFFNSLEIGGTQIATPVQIYLDLQDNRGRGEEAAVNIRKVIEQSWQ